MMRLALLALFLPTVALAQESVIDVQMQTAREFLGTAGYQPHDWRRGTLDGYEVHEFEIDVLANVDYAVFAACDQNCLDLDLAVWEEPFTGALIVTDTELDSYPLVQFTLPDDARVCVHVVMVQCRADPCSYGVAVFRRDSLP